MPSPLRCPRGRGLRVGLETAQVLRPQTFAFRAAAAEHLERALSCCHEETAVAVPVCPRSLGQRCHIVGPVLQEIFQLDTLYPVRAKIDSAMDETERHTVGARAAQRHLRLAFNNFPTALQLVPHVSLRPI